MAKRKRTNRQTIKWSKEKDRQNNGQKKKDEKYRQYNDQKN